FAFMGICRPPPAFTVGATRDWVPLGGPSEANTGAPYCASPTRAPTYALDWPTRGRNHKRLAFELSALMWPSPRRYATSVSTLSVDVTGNVTAVPKGDAPADPSPTYGVTSTVFASCAPTGTAASVNATSATTAELRARMTPPQPLDAGGRTFRRPKAPNSCYGRNPPPLSVGVHPCLSVAFLCPYPCSSVFIRGLPLSLSVLIRVYPWPSSVFIRVCPCSSVAVLVFIRGQQRLDDGREVRLRESGGDGVVVERARRGRDRQRDAVRGGFLDGVSQVLAHQRQREVDVVVARQHARADGLDQRAPGCAIGQDREGGVA